jgi:hypothetical protein
MLNDSLKTKGVLELKLLDAFGNVKEQYEHNLIVNTGLAYIASRMKDTTAGVMTHMAVGTGGTSPVGANTTLGSELARQALDSTTVTTTTVSNDSIQYVSTFGPGTGTGAITEAGLFNYTPYTGSPSASQIMLCRTTFSVINKGALDSLVITWKVTVA